MSVFKTDGSTSSFEPLPVGEYECIVTKAEVTQAKSSGADMVKLTLTVRDLPEQAKYKGRNFFNNLVFTANAMPIVQTFMTAVGIPAGTDFATYEDVCKAVAMKPVRLKNKHTMYQGEKQDSVSYVMPTKHPLGQVAGEVLPSPSAPVLSTGSAPASAPAQRNDDLPF